MNSTGKVGAVLAWAAGYPPLGGRLRLNATDISAGEFSMQTVAGSAESRRFIDGTVERAVTVSLQYVADWSGGTDEVNAEAQATGEGWLDWCSRQHRLGNDPDMGDASVRDVVPLQGGPVLAAAYNDGEVARYAFEIQVIYWEKE